VIGERAVLSTQLPGPVLFARYAFGPNRLGFCGPADSQLFIEQARAGEIRGLRELIPQFEGAYPYLALIASANAIPDPLDPRVVEAYWVGNGLLRQVTPPMLHRSVDDRFRRRLPLPGWRELERALELAAHPNHAFHVLEVMPLVGLLRGGEVENLLDTMDACRIRCGRVLDVAADALVVEIASLQLDGGRLAIGAPRTQRIARWFDGAPEPPPTPGELVSVHWGWACQRLTRRQAVALEHWTEQALVAANRGAG
jgi:hypothetical protein